MSKELGARIKHFRNQKKMTQAELAKAVGVATITIRQYESGARDPNTSILEKIGIALGLENELYTIYPEDQQAAAIKYKFLQFWNNGKNAEDTPAYSPLNDNLRKIEHSLMHMNTEGQLVAVERVEELAQMPKYQLAADDPNTDPTQK